MFFDFQANGVIFAVAVGSPLGNDVVAKNVMTAQAIPKVYVCHSGNDRLATSQIVADLKLAGAEVWVDYERVPKVGGKFDIASVLSQQEYLILVQSPAAVSSNIVVEAMDLASNMRVANELKDIIPVVVADCSGAQVPALWDSLHRYDATQGYLRAIRGLVKAVGLDPNDIQSRPDLPLANVKNPLASRHPALEKSMELYRRLPSSVFGLLIGLVGFLILVWVVSTFWPR